MVLVFDQIVGSLELFHDQNQNWNHKHVSKQGDASEARGPNGHVDSVNEIQL